MRVFAGAPLFFCLVVVGADLMFTTPAFAQQPGGGVGGDDVPAEKMPEKSDAPVPTVSEPAPGPPAIAPAPPSVPLAPPAKTELVIKPLGYVEVYYAYNFNRPSNGITNFRGFDNRHNTFSLTNAALGATWDYGPVGGKIIGQIGSTGASYYSSEPGRAGAAGANATGAELWRYLQEAYLTYKAPIGRGLLIQAGLAASPIGIEQFAVKDHWTWSRSNLFFGFPYYHTGVRFKYEWTDAFSTTFAVFNGWNSVVDNNEEKSIQTDVRYRIGEKVSAQLLYFGGIERTTGSPEGPYWRHHFDAVIQAQLHNRLAAAAQADYGFEPNRIGTARWWAVAAAARVRIFPWLFFVYRGDRFHEHLATDARGRSSSPLFWNGSEWVTSGTSTLDFRPHDNISIRLEHRLDVAEQPIYFRKNVQGDGTPASPYIANALYQETLLLGATAWF